jgi:hypothetical protein
MRETVLRVAASRISAGLRRSAGDHGLTRRGSRSYLTSGLMNTRTAATNATRVAAEAGSRLWINSLRDRRDAIPDAQRP